MPLSSASYTHQLEEANHTKPRLGWHEFLEMGIIADLACMADGQEVKAEINNTILSGYLPKPLLSVQQITFSMKFDTY